MRRISRIGRPNVRFLDAETLFVGEIKMFKFRHVFHCFLFAELFVELFVGLFVGRFVELFVALFVVFFVVRLVLELFLYVLELLARGDLRAPSWRPMFQQVLPSKIRAQPRALQANAHPTWPAAFANALARVTEHSGFLYFIR